VCPIGFSGDDNTCTEQECPSSAFKCHSGRCVSREHMCDGEDDCGQGEDEEGCSETKCRPNMLCLQDGQDVCKRKEDILCDIWSDCDGNATEVCSLDGADEKGNKTIQGGCLEMLLPCGENSNECFAPTKKCDGQFECSNKFDESECANAQCEHGLEVSCNTTYHQCISLLYMCDGVNDCSNSADEFECPGLANDEAEVVTVEPPPGVSVEPPPDSLSVRQRTMHIIAIIMINIAFM
jgi:hypothetical protein